jgi:DNA polymerase III subunit epsilon
MRNFVAIDFETANSHRSSVCSVGIVIVREGVVVDRLYRLIRPQPDFYSPWNTRVHGLTDQDTYQAPQFPEVWREIAPLIEGLPLLAHNSPFDEGCLKAVHLHYGMEYPMYPFFCTYRAARKAFPHLPNHQLHTVSAQVGFDLRHHHHALADAEACARIGLTLFADSLF